jgi:hypothetical protein
MDGTHYMHSTPLVRHTPKVKVLQDYAIWCKTSPKEKWYKLSAEQGQADQQADAQSNLSLAHGTSYSSKMVQEGSRAREFNGPQHCPKCLPQVEGTISASTVKSVALASVYSQHSSYHGHCTKTVVQRVGVHAEQVHLWRSERLLYC